MGLGKALIILRLGFGGVHDTRIALGTLRNCGALFQPV